MWIIYIKCLFSSNIKVQLIKMNSSHVIKRQISDLYDDESGYVNYMVSNKIVRVDSSLHLKECSVNVHRIKLTQNLIKTKSVETQTEEYKQWECPVCFEFNENRVISYCGHMVCQECCDRIMHATMKCPMCRAYMFIRINFKCTT